MAISPHNIAATPASQSGQNVDSIPMPAAAMAMVCTTYLMFSVLDTIGKYLVLNGFSPAMVVWVRFLVHGLILFIVLRAWSHREVWRINNRPLHFLRSTLLPLTTMFNFAALQYLPLDQTVTIFLATPMVVTALGGPLLGEWAGPRRWAAVLVGFVGVVIVARPGTTMFDWPILLSMGATLTYSIYTLLTRKLAHSETQSSLNFYPTLFGSTLLLPFAVMEWHLPQVPLEGFLLIMAGVVGLTGHLLLIKASRLTSASKIAPFIYTQIVWMVALGWLVFGDVPDFYTILGAFIICSSGFYLMNRERQLRKAARK
jgi:drug/metabolite transporter (DMT)-like permease